MKNARHKNHVWWLTALSVMLGVSCPVDGQDGLEELDPRNVNRSDRLADDGTTDWPMYLDPYLPSIGMIRTFLARLKPLWLEAMDQPQLETRRRAVDTIGQAHLEGMPGLSDTAPKLIAILEVEDQPLILRLAAARTLIRLEAKESADVLLKQNRLYEPEMVMLTDPALAAWKHQPADAMWLERIAADGTPAAVRISAIHALRTARVAAAADTLRSLAADRRRAADLRLTAAEALGVIVPAGSEATAETLMQGDIVDRTVAARLLAQHRGQQAEEILLRLAVDDEPTIAAAALQRLLEIDPLLIEPIAPPLRANADPKVRLLAAQAVAAQRSVRAIELLTPLLNDIAPSVRFYVRQQFIVMDADANLSSAVRSHATMQLAGPNWRQTPDEELKNFIDRDWRHLEQAAMVLGAVDHEPVAARLVELLDYPRTEVRVAAATALRRLAVPEMLPGMLAYAERTADFQLAGPFPSFREDIVSGYDLDVQMAQLMQTFGQLRYAPADPLMRRHIPKESGFGEQARAASIWSLGHLHEDRPDEALAQAMVERLTDESIMNPERTVVRRMSAISIGRMRAESQLDALNLYAAREGSSEIAGATRWAVTRMTGQTFPPDEPSDSRQLYWFLRPDVEENHDDDLRATD